MHAPCDPRLHSPAAQRNRDAILAQLLRMLPARGRALEIASGSGQHVQHFAAAMPDWQWQPSDADPAALASIAARCADAGLANVAPPLGIDLLAEHPADAAPWTALPVDLVYCANLVHIAPRAACIALMHAGAAWLAENGRLLLYGPFLVEGETVQPGNRAFDADLRARNPAWGLRWLHEVVAEAQLAGLAPVQRIDMPANNLLLAFARPARA